MSKTTLDFLVTAVDNYGDTGFALDLAESLLSRRPNWTVRFFSDDRALFDRLVSERPHPGVSYFELADYETFEPSDKIVSFFDRKLPEAHFAKYDFPKKILQLSYLRFDADSEGRPGVGSLNGTRYLAGDDEVVHSVPSPLKEGAGVVVGSVSVPYPGIRNFSETTSLRIDSWKIPKPGTGTSSNSDVDSDFRTVSVFCYLTTRAKLEAMRAAEPRLKFAEFGNPEAEIPLPFLRFDEYASALGNFGGNVVRGENSAVKAMLASKPFLWDFYKESNGAHREKIEDFLAFVEPFFGNGVDFGTYANATRAFNSDEFSSEGARKCADVLMGGGSRFARAFERMAEAVQQRDLTMTVIGELEA